MVKRFFKKHIINIFVLLSSRFFCI